MKLFLVTLLLSLVSVGGVSAQAKSIVYPKQICLAVGGSSVVCFQKLTKLCINSDCAITLQTVLDNTGTNTTSKFEITGKVSLSQGVFKTDYKVGKKKSITVNTPYQRSQITWN
jgi:hypothetical protein